MRTPVIAGNWKLHGAPDEAARLARAVRNKTASLRGIEVVIAPPTVSLAHVARVLDDSHVRLAAQNLFWETRGAYTGEVSAPMLRAVGCSHVLVGHSERRQLFGETDATVARRVRAALDEGLVPVVCIGESLAQREAGETTRVVEAQLLTALEGVGDEEAAGLLIAYEPVWAIGTGRTASPQQAQEVHAQLRARLGARFDSEAARAVRLLYGGSVKSDNAQALLAQPDIDGALVGGASLDPDAFAAIARAALT